MKRILILLCFPMIFTSCSKDEESESFSTGTVKFEASSANVPFEVRYRNAFGNLVTETSSVTYWTTEFTGEDGEHYSLSINPEPTNGIGYHSCTISISYRGNVLVSFSGSTSNEMISCTLE
jgi:hypothetical protein